VLLTKHFTYLLNTLLDTARSFSVIFVVLIIIIISTHPPYYDTMKFVLLLAAFAADPASAFTTGLTLATTTPPSSSLSSRKSSLRLDAASVASDGVANGTDKKKIIVLGGDGFCGWPTSLYLSDQGHDVVIVDNLSRRNIDTELGCDSLTPIQPPGVSYKLHPCPSLILEEVSSILPRSLPRRVRPVVLGTTMMPCHFFLHLFLFVSLR
jgi:hypothetical protein